MNEYQLSNGEGIVQQTADPEFPLLLTCALREQSPTDPRLWQILILIARANRMVLIDWARTVAEQCKYSEPDSPRG